MTCTHENILYEPIEESGVIVGRKTVCDDCDQSLELHYFSAVDQGPLAQDRAEQGDGTTRKAHYGEGTSWDIIVEQGWGPHFAAANVLKYLRCTKNVEHARWYYMRLWEDASCSAVLWQLEHLLSLDEIVFLRTKL